MVEITRSLIELKKLCDIYIERKKGSKMERSVLSSIGIGCSQLDIEAELEIINCFN